ncbi:ribokinase [Tabrizicola sp. J26]|uniref:ribokinase n=1 Tax=Alitabrizicola rongguiensis TaxID=2909234 RepID=UPI001F324B98|nr:ribokinase [Tabrizicola rongguiensis]MCF1709735.1 ribokinase [Tabrizicola rongguiensis]
MAPSDTVLVAGSLHYDIMVEADHLPRPDETAVGSRWYPKFGGKGGNQAVAIARAGGRVRMLGAVGTDDFGNFLRAGLRSAGVDDRYVATLSDHGSGMSVAIQDRAGDYAATIVSGANLFIPRPANAADLWSGIGLVVLQNEVSPALNLSVAQEARSLGIPTLLNAAPWRDPAPDFVELVDILVVNAVEAEMMGAGKVDSLEAARAAADHLAHRFGSVVVTAGGNGLAASRAGLETIVLPAERVKVVSTHGAGDAFIGAFAAATIQGERLKEACQRASHAAALHVAGKSRAAAV